MPAYSFKERFVPMVLDGSKPHTIRNRRKNPARVGDPLYLYFGMRTKWCRKLREETCLKTGSILITQGGRVYLFDGLLAPHFTAQGISSLADIWKIEITKFTATDGTSIGCRKLYEDEKQRLSWLDGFRPEGSTLDEPGEAFELMYRYWSIANSLPYLGDIIYWSLAYEPAL